MRIDLHTHSAVSDGTESPAEVMAQAARAGLDVVALCDHDSVAGWEEAREAGKAHGVEWVPGIEVSARHHGTSVHLLSYWHDPRDAEAEAMIAKTRDARVHRAQAIVDLLGQRYPVTWADVVEQSGGAVTVGRPHIADALVARGVVADRSAAFTEILRPGSAFYVPHYAPEVVDAVRTMRAAGGVPVVAHPYAGRAGAELPTRVVERAAAAGLVGLEVDHRDHTAEQRARLRDLAASSGLVATGSSDYHGAGKPNELGENLTSPEAYAALQAAR
ncbi:PHP domain-containing protein [Demequina globuliformis]|uniref:PHP domain-containing protein n=1 Tax=Demequina globuliformis TaxID=676202 RepID=UPI0007836B4B|nr:PHP domain-containing protein [Demequina globuliformis]